MNTPTLKYIILSCRCITEHGIYHGFNHLDRREVRTRESKVLCEQPEWETTHAL